MYDCYETDTHSEMSTPDQNESVFVFALKFLVLVF